ncbi:anthrax toxin lethal factor-related metalloendopeptidase [Bacillus sp. Marseille-P3661]|uniref:anthrax toxin lethal factor-related metalloendopeptidase n=1 Tax=Bacillus sp. Marseille-P3661 TaxID=1936234 RepID=UPI000C8577DF|nr:hypothetical protein [Bacillus sp. Marseille-P3661]
MKQLFVFCLLLLCTLPTLSVAKGEITGLSLKKANEMHGINIEFDNKEIERLVGQLILLPNENDYDHKEVRSMVSRISKIHPTLLHDLVVNNVKIKLFTGKLTDEGPFTHLSGISPRGWSPNKTWDQVPGAGGTYIAAAKIGASSYGKGHGSVNLELHEIGHSVERKVFDKLRNDSVFIGIWKDEVFKLFPKREYFQNYPEEYFAEVFAMYYLNEKTNANLKQTAPKTHEYLKKLEEKKRDFVYNVVTRL